MRTLDLAVGNIAAAQRSAFHGSATPKDDQTSYPQVRRVSVVTGMDASVGAFLAQIGRKQTSADDDDAPETPLTTRVEKAQRQQNRHSRMHHRASVGFMGVNG